MAEESTEKSFDLTCSNCNKFAKYKIKPNYCAFCGCKYGINNESLYEKEATAVTIAVKVKINACETITPEQFWKARSKLTSRFQNKTVPPNKINELKEITYSLVKAVSNADKKASDLGVMKEIGPELDELASLTLKISRQVDALI